MARIPAALIMLAALFYTAPAFGQTYIYQFTGTADVEVDDVLQTNVLVRIELQSAFGFVGGIPQGDTTEERFANLTAGTIIIEGVSYELDVTNMSLRRPDSNGSGIGTDYSSYEAADGIILSGVDLSYPSLAIHYDAGAASEYFHFFEADAGSLNLGNTDLVSDVLTPVGLLPTEQDRGGIANNIGYDAISGERIEIDFDNVASNINYTAFSSTSGLDFGDAPSPAYKTLSADAGPSHFFSASAARLGATVDTEADGQPNAGATGDGADEDGVSFPISMVANTGTVNTAAVLIDIQNAADGDLDAWIDFDQDGVFNSTDEYVLNVDDLAIGTHLLPIVIPSSALSGTTFARFRLSTGGTGFPFGSAADGEVEDYQVVILDGSSAQDITIDLGAGGTLVQPITIWQTPGGDTEIHDGNPTTYFSAPQSAVDELNVTGTSGDDEFIVDYVNGKVANGTITIDGAGQVSSPGGDQITLNNGSQDTIEHDYTNANDGFIYYSDSPGPPFETIAYVNLEPITDNLDAVNRIFTFNSSANIIDFDFVAGGPSIISTTPTTSEITTFNGPSLPGANVVINGGGGADEFYVEPSDEYPITVNGGAPTTIPGDVFELDAASLVGNQTITLMESSDVDGVYSFTGGYEDVTYTSMEQVNLRFSDPNAFAGDTYPGDHFYPIHTETGISVEPYFNWDIDNWPTVGSSALATLTLHVSENSDLSLPLFSTTTWEDNATSLITRFGGAGDLDHYVTDIDRAWNSVFPLENDHRYYWGLVADLAGGDIFQQISRFDTVQELDPVLDYPDDGLTLYDDEILFNWNVASPTQDDVYWRMDLDVNDKLSFNGATPLVMGGDAFNDNDTDPADGFAAETEFASDDLPSPLVWGTTYSWRVATMWPVPPTGWVPQEIFNRHETDRAVTFSSVSEFSMVTKAVVPTPSYPIDGLVVPNNSPELNWWVGGPFDSLTFDIEIREFGGGVVCSATGITGLQYDTEDCSPDLVPGTTYEWRVRSYDGTNTSAYSDWETFTTNGQGIAAQATPSYPVDGLEIYTINPQFHWFTERDNTGVDFTVYYYKTGTEPASCGVAGFVDVLYPDTGVTHVDVTDLEPGATYFWCVQSEGSNTPPAISSEFATFEVAGGMDKNFPVASWPVGNPTVYQKDQILHWYLEGSYFDWVSFDVEYCIFPDTFGDAGCTEVTGITEQQYELTGLDYGDIVEWRVKAHYTSGMESDWTNPASQGQFTVVGLLSSMTAVPTYPVNGLVLSESEATFSWYVAGATGVANYFKIQYSYTESFSTIGNITIELTTPDEFLTVSDLIPGHVYWWRVAVSNDGGATYGAWSAVASFSVKPGASAPMPRIGGPTNLVGVATTSPTLSWVVPSQSTSDVVYDVRVSTDGNFGKGGVIEITDLTMPFVRLTDLEAGEYYWQVRSRTVDGTSTSPYSEMGRFSTTASFSVDTEEAPDAQLPASFELGQNYPNPFNPTTTIEYRMAETAHVSIKVYNMLGQVVKTLVNGTMPAGTHRVDWNATDDSGTAVSTGVYMYRMEAGGQTAARTLVLMK